ncbi:sensor domain-containing diguanylate cyclase [candidate division FCPU426 bacterium]|nr:sensor domain-containing diguanylate cyclase [candidate division FCPU426 bacterium]
MFDLRNPFLQRSKFILILYGSLVLIVGLLLVVFVGIRMIGTRTGLLLLFISLLLIAVTVLINYLMFSQLLKPIQVLIRETEETLQGMRKGGISLVRDDEIGLLANNFNQIVLDAQMKRMELETSNRELASHAEIIEKTYRELDKKVYDLFTLFNIGKELNSTLSVESILKITCFTSMGQLGITTMSILFLEAKDDEQVMTKVYMKGLRKDPQRAEVLATTEDFLNLLRMNEQSLLMSDLEEKSEYKNEIDFFNAYKAHLIAPLMAKDQIIGIMILGKKLSGEEFVQGEKDFINTLASLSALALRNARHYEQAITDAMTKLFLKRYFQLRLDDEIKRADRYHNKITLLMSDIDHFKNINDTYGHTKGDEVLIAVAKAIRDNFRDVDVPARYGGEEFAVIMPEISKEEAMIPAERLRKAIEKISFVLNGEQVTVTISIGLAEYSKDAKSPLQLIEAADAALYRSKENGRNQTTLA